MPSNHLILCHLLLFLPSIFPSIRVFSNELIVIHNRWPKYWNFSLSISSSKEYSGLISFRIDWFDRLTAQRTLKSPPAQIESINSLALSLLDGPTLTSLHDYWKKHSVDNTHTCLQTDVSVLFNMITMFIIAFFLEGASVF